MPILVCAPYALDNLGACRKAHGWNCRNKGVTAIADCCDNSRLTLTEQFAGPVAMQLTRALQGTLIYPLIANYAPYPFRYEYYPYNHARVSCQDNTLRFNECLSQVYCATSPYFFIEVHYDILETGTTVQFSDGRKLRYTLHDLHALSRSIETFITPSQVHDYNHKQAVTPACELFTWFWHTYGRPAIKITLSPYLSGRRETALYCLFLDLVSNALLHHETLTRGKYKRGLHSFPRSLLSSAIHRGIEAEPCLEWQLVSMHGDPSTFLVEKLHNLPPTPILNALNQVREQPSTQTMR
jgi:hypothetical protein